MMKELIARFYRRSALNVLAGAVLVALLFYVPISVSQRKELLGRFDHAVELRAVTIQFTLENFVSGVDALSSRTVIREALFSYTRGEIGFQELVSFTREKYHDGARALRNLTGARRSLTDGTDVCSYGDTSALDTVPRTLPGVWLKETAGGPVFIASKPIIEEGNLIGWEAGAFDASFMFEHLPDEIERIAVVQEENAAPPDGSYVRRVDLEGFPFILEAEMDLSLLLSARRSIFLRVILYTALTFLAIVALFHLTQYRFVMGLIGTLKAELDKKDLLIREVHHRIKNNTGAIESLLYMQAGETASADAREALSEASGRVGSMRKLYQRMLDVEGYREMAVGDYLGDIAEHVVSLFPGETAITLETRFDDIVLDGSVLFPLGIIVNELATNAVKYAFSSRPAGTLRVSVRRSGNRIVLTVEDDGVGLPEGHASAKPGGLGLAMVELLAEQIDGTLSMESGPGTRAVIEFGSG